MVGERVENGWVSFRSKPLAYHFRKLRTGYHFVENERGKAIALSPGQRRFVGAVNRLANLPQFLRRRALGRAAIRAAPSAPSMRDGYVELSVLDGYREVIKLCEKQTRLYLDFLERGAAALEGKGIDLNAYEAEIARTADDPLKHVPVRFNSRVTTTLANFAMQPVLLAAATRHIGVLPILATVRILYSPNAPGDLTMAQLFHLDPEGARQAKGFMAIRAVGKANSPLTFVPASLTHQMLRSGNEIYRGKRVPDKYINRMAPASGWIEHTGEPGATVLLDTSQCFHFGSRPAAEPRLLLYFSYLDPFGSHLPMHRPLKKLAKAWSDFRGGPSPFVDYVLGRRL